MSDVSYLLLFIRNRAVVNQSQIVTVPEYRRGNGYSSFNG
jgi:hypothetical protein